MSHHINRRGFFQSLKLGAAGTASVVVSPSSEPAQAAADDLLPFETSRSIRRDKSPVTPERVLLWENTRKEIREWLTSGKLKAAILPTGSIEQHNEHMAMVADVANSTLISQRAALELYPAVVVAPPSPCGYAPYHMARKGTITLRRETFQAYVYDVMESLKAHGIRTILVLNGHGGNHQPLQEVLPRFRKELGINIEATSYWIGTPPSYTKTIMKSKQPTSHAGEFETSIYMAAYPDRLRPFSMGDYDDAHLNYEDNFAPDVLPFLRRDGRTFKQGKIDCRDENIRDRRRQAEALLATSETGEAILSKATSYVVELVQRMIAATEAGNR